MDCCKNEDNNESHDCCKGKQNGHEMSHNNNEHDEKDYYT